MEEIQRRQAETHTIAINEHCRRAEQLEYELKQVLHPVALLSPVIICGNSTTFRRIQKCKGLVLRRANTESS